ncbi:Kelch motif protein [Chitinophaga niastensis]|uniref:Kelch motif protein n=1 Tax=Chitinophaga niastensis TaxID=536980 RepID=A0A2P8HMY7_CHINA|nr:kelch repeat-containing protein [Chitinophaga niastensis]PSL47583.1 Kelch motif protein [Chitinophaga niastensis]
MRYLKGYSLLLMASLVACSKGSNSPTLVGDWNRLNPAQFGGVARSSAASFVIDNKAYIGTGYDGTNRLQDFWMFDVDKNQWTQKAPLTGAARNGAVGMAMAGKGYVGTGYDGLNKLNDFYQYDPVANTWVRKADFAGSPRYGSVSFALKDKGYITTGYDGNWLNDNWQYDPATNAWTQASSLNNGKRTDASAFVIGNKAYVCMGTANSTFITTFYSFDGDTQSWTTLRPIDNVSDQSYDDAYNFKGSGAASFAMRGKGYITSGSKGSLSSATWEYTPETDLWLQKTDFKGAARTGATGFTVKDRGFVVLGVSSSQPFDDMFEFDPTATYNAND